MSICLAFKGGEYELTPLVTRLMLAIALTAQCGEDHRDEPEKLINVDLTG
ncbi:hypothetical protein [Pedobacter lusitanus]|nr:hypothetical protein [Pedobacter lusitanus]